MIGAARCNDDSQLKIDLRLNRYELDLIISMKRVLRSYLKIT